MEPHTECPSMKHQSLHNGRMWCSRSLAQGAVKPRLFFPGSNFIRVSAARLGSHLKNWALNATCHRFHTFFFFVSHIWEHANSDEVVSCHRVKRDAVTYVQSQAALRFCLFVFPLLLMGGDPTTAWLHFSCCCCYLLPFTWPVNTFSYLCGGRKRKYNSSRFW